MPNGVSAFQAANPAVGTVARSQQTTVVPVDPNAPFTRQSRQAQQLGFVLSGLAFGATISQQLPAAGGYLRALSITVTAAGGAGTATVALTADSPWNVLGGSIQLKDATGNPIYNVDSFSLYLINLFSGMWGQGGNQNPAGTAVTPKSSYSAPVTGANGSGNFALRLIMPLEFDSSGYCSLSDMNASAQPLFQCVLATAASVYSTAPTTAPTLTVQVNMLFWTIPQGNPMAAPPDVGSSHQWTITTGGQNPTTGASVRVRHPSPGTYISSLICVLRDATNARVNAFPATDLTFWLDDFPLKNSELLTERQDEIARQFSIPLGVDQGTAAGNVKTVGVLVYSFRGAVQDEVSKADTSDELLPTSPATKLEVGGTWGTITSSPGQLFFLTGWLYPANANRIPWTHLAN
ncbi:MAG: hypothetical protein ACRDRL_16295 [Sciscionella sp.]